MKKILQGMANGQTTIIKVPIAAEYIFEVVRATMEVAELLRLQ